VTIVPLSARCGFVAAAGGRGHSLIWIVLVIAVLFLLFGHSGHPII
jgi:hypothetical protein